MVPARPFLGPAFKALRGRAETTITEDTMKEVLAAAQRAAAKGRKK
jgi:hypothetical protein